MSNYTELVEECRNPLITRLGDAYRKFGLFVAIVSWAVLLASLVWWQRNREKSRLTLRTEPSLILVTMYGVFGVIGSSLHTYSLDAPSFLNRCESRWSFMLAAVVAFNGFICLRLYNYYAMTLIYQEVTKNSKGRLKDYSTLTTPSLIAETEFSNLDHLVYKSSNQFSFFIVLFIICVGAAVIFPVIYVTCPVLNNDIVCELEDDLKYPVFLLFFAIVLVSTTVLIFVGCKTRKMPDPFEVKKEAKWLVFFLISFFLLTLLSGVVVKERTQDPDAMFKITPSIIADFFILLIVIYAIPFQVHKSIYAEQRFIINKTLNDILKDPVTKDLLRSFLKSELSCNNLDFYLAASQWKKSFEKTQFDARQKSALNIANRWINTTSDNEINIGHGLKQNLNDELRKSRFPDTLFDEILADIYRLINNDPFMRFQRSAPYKMYMGLLVDADELGFANY